MKKAGIIAIMIGVITVIIGMIQRNKASASISIIGGADGPTSIFLAGKIGGAPAMIGIVIGILLLIIGVLLVMRKK